MKSKIDIIKYVVTLSDNWFKMEQLSDNTLENHQYFNARYMVDMDFLTWLNNIEFDEEKIHYYLLNNFEEQLKNNLKYFEEHHSWNEIYSAKCNEYSLLLSILKKNYSPEFSIGGALIKNLYYQFFGKHMNNNVKTQ